MYDKILNELILLSNNNDKETLQWFFKTSKGEYGEGDLFLGIKVPILRKLSKKYYKELTLEEIEKLLQNIYHEIREFAIFILILKYNDSPKEIYDLYLNNLKYINNWDLVDQSASYIVGKYLYDNNMNRQILYELSNKELWEQRIAIISTHYFIRNNDYSDTLELSKKYLNTKHDLIKKAVGWMLREVGKRDYNTLYNFLNDNIKEISSITFSYATERIPKDIKEELNVKRCKYKNMNYLKYTNYTIIK